MKSKMNALFSLVLLLACQTVLGRSVTTTTNVADEVNIISRAQWGSSPLVTPATKLVENPPSFVVIHHSDTPPCTTQATCQARVRNFQEYHIKTKKWDDIGYNFVVGEDGNIYEGRGWGKRGAHSVLYNSKSIGICIIGNFANRVPNEAAINATKKLIAYGVANGKILDNYNLLGHKQTAQTSCPGRQLYDLIKTWPHWSDISI